MEKFAALVTIVNTRREAYFARRERIEAAFSESNHGMTPTRDVNGRYHAPCDGYVLPNAHRNDYNRDYDGHCFGKGEFLPIPLSNDDKFFGSSSSFDPSKYEYKRKVKATVEVINELKNCGFPLDVSHGKTWEQGGVAVAYCYLSGLWKELVDEAVKVLEESLQNSLPKEPEVYMEEGRHTVTGVITFCQTKIDPMYGVLEKMMVTTSEGHKLYGTRPSSVAESNVGKTITFTATFKKGKNGMSFYSRPAKVQLS
jgi:hypothetical protein